MVPAVSRVRIEPSIEGAKFVFPPPGGPKSIAGFLACLAVTAGIAWGISKAGAPLLFTVVASAFGLIPAVVFLWSAAGEVRVLIGPRGVELIYRLLGFEKAWRAAPGEVLEAGISVAGQYGQAPSYVILLRRQNSNPLWIVAMLAGKDEADWIASEINRRLVA
jgi:hypothetical protein